MSEEYSISWQQFILALSILIILYMLLSAVRGILQRARFLGPLRTRLIEGMRVFLLVFEPLAILFILVIFAFVNLPINALVLVLLLLFSINHINNYINGQLLKFNPAFGVGKQIKVQQYQGILTSLGKFGFKIKTNQGVQYLQYASLMNYGYLLFSGENISGFYQLAISLAEPVEKGRSLKTSSILDLLAVSPYLDWTQEPEIFPSSTADEIHIRVLVKEENHLYDLMTLIKEKGYTCEIVQL